jgi:hypothetical protein
VRDRFDWSRTAYFSCSGVSDLGHDPRHTCNAVWRVEGLGGLHRSIISGGLASLQVPQNCVAASYPNLSQD